MTILDTYLWRSRNTIERHDAPDGQSVRFEFPLGFMIQADRKGVTFVGTSINYDAGSIQEVERAIRWATQINVALRDGHGIPPQQELEGKLAIQSKKDMAWWKGRYKEKVRAQDGVSAPAILRRLIRDQELKMARERE